MSRRRGSWEEEEEDFRKPAKQEKDKYNKHRKAIYDLMYDDEDEDDYFNDNYSYRKEDDEY